MPKLQVLCKPDSGIDYHRLINPISYLDMGEGWEIELLWFNKDEARIDCDVLLFCKYAYTEPRWLKKIQAKGTKIIVDVDDSWELSPSHIYYRHWMDNGLDQRVLECIKLADVVTCTTMALQDKIREHNKNTVVIPNAFPYGYECYKPSDDIVERVKMTFIYAGGSTHLPDIKLLEGKFKRIGGDKWIKDRSEFLLAGYEKTEIPKYRSKEDYENQRNPVMVQIRTDWDKMASIFSQTDTYGIIPSRNLDDYVNVYDMADVGLVPLVDSTWNRYKSTLKVAEIATKRIPAIVSKVEPYWPELQDCPGVMWITRPDDWLAHIKDCIKNPGKVKDNGELMADYIWKHYDLPTWNITRKQVIESL